MPLPAIVLLALFSTAICGCSLSNLVKSSPPMYFEVDYPPQTVECDAGSGAGLRVWHFSASAPYDRDEMIVLDPTQQVKFSPQYRWIAPPANMVSDRLLRDISRTGLFVNVVPAGDPYNASMEMGGRIFRFAWEEQGATGRAVLDIEVSLWSVHPKRHVMFRREYHLEGPPAEAGSPEIFTESMSTIVSQLSSRLCMDLCAKLKGNWSQDDE